MSAAATRTNPANYRLEALEARLLLSADGLVLRPVVEDFYTPNVVEIVAASETSAAPSAADSLAYQPADSGALDMFGSGAELTPVEAVVEVVEAAPNTPAAADEISDETVPNDAAADGNLPVLGAEAVAAQATPEFVEQIQEQLVTGLTVGNAPPAKTPANTPVSAIPSAEPQAGIGFALSATSLADLHDFITGKLTDYLNGLLSGTRTFSPGTLSLGGFFTLLNPSLTFSSIVIGQGAVTSGTVTIATEGATLFDGRPFSASVTDGDDEDAFAASGTYDATTKSYSVAVDQFVLTVGEALRVEAPAVTVTYCSSDTAA
ncbi:MAG: LEPR-XLL domain-containing protein, partial [Limisphaerales bacterium]